MGALMAVEALALAVLGLLVVGLLRSHAEILRRLHDLGVNLDDDEAGHRHGAPGAGVTTPVTFSPPTSPRTQGEAAPSIVGVTPFDEAVTVAPGGGDQDTVLAFLTTGCTSCQAFWDALKDRSSYQGRRVVVVTRGPGDESLGAARKLAGSPTAMDVVMSSEGWDDYAVPGAPYFVHVSAATGRVTGEGTARSWDQVLELLARSDADDADDADDAATPAASADVAAARPQSAPPSGLSLEDGPAGPWASDAEREARIDQDLQAAGIYPGDPRLFHGKQPDEADT